MGHPVRRQRQYRCRGDADDGGLPRFCLRSDGRRFRRTTATGGRRAPNRQTNLDQFATGLVGMRTPYPAPRNAVDPEVVAGGSSSGSAAAVAQGLVSFALGTDTAGSGRVPAALNGIAGLKPSARRIVQSGRRAGMPDVGLRIDIRADRRRRI